MSNNSDKFIGFVILSLVGIFLLSFNFVIAQDYPNTPVGIAQKYFDSIAENDTNKYLDSITPEDRRLPGIPFVRQLVQGLLGYYGLGNMDAAKISIRFVNLSFQEIFNDGAIARVQVTGSMRDLNLGIESPLSTELMIVNIDGNWLVEIYDLGNQLPTVNTALTFPHNATAPETPEQIAAATAFEQYMDQSGTQYRGAQYETTQSTSTSAVVEIKMEILDSQTGIWVEHSTMLPMRLLVGQWRADTSNVTLTITEKGQAVLTTFAATNAQATQVAADIEGQNFAKLLGGTLVYVLDDNKTIEGRRPDGSLFDIMLGDKGRIELLELMPDGQGFYFVERIYVAQNLVTQILYQYTFINEQSISIDHYSVNQSGEPVLIALSASPDSTRLAISFDNGNIQVIPLLNGISTVSAQLPEDYSATGLVWSPTSDIVYMRTSFGYSYQSPTVSKWHPEANQNIETLLEIPYQDGNDNGHIPNLAISPNGSDLFLGGTTFGLLSITDKSQFDLSGGQQVVACNPIYSTDGSKIVTLIKGNTLSTFDLTIGNWIPILQLPVIDNLTYKCPVFDWVPQTTLHTASMSATAIALATQNSIPTFTPTLSPTNTSTSTPTSSPTLLPTFTLGPTLTNSQVKILWVVRPGDPLNEQIDIQNIGNSVNLEGWKITDTQGNTYTFPERVLSSNGNITVFTRKGQDAANEVFWNRDDAVFEPGDSAILMDNNNNIQSIYKIPI